MSYCYYPSLADEETETWGEDDVLKVTQLGGGKLEFEPKQSHIRARAVTLPCYAALIRHTYRRGESGEKQVSGHQTRLVPVRLHQGTWRPVILL